MNHGLDFVSNKRIQHCCSASLKYNHALRVCIPDKLVILKINITAPRKLNVLRSAGKACPVHLSALSFLSPPTPPSPPSLFYPLMCITTIGLTVSHHMNFNTALIMAEDIPLGRGWKATPAANIHAALAWITGEWLRWQDVWKHAWIFLYVAHDSMTTHTCTSTVKEPS